MVENIIEKSLGRNRDFDELSDEELLIKLRDEANALLLEHQAKMVDVAPEDGRIAQWRSIGPTWCCQVAVDNRRVTATGDYL